MHREPILQREQHGRFEAVHVLGRHGPYERRPGRAIEPKGARLGERPAGERAPALQVRRRLAGRTRSERDRRHVVVGDGRRAAARRGAQAARVAHRFQRAPRDILVRKAVEPGIGVREPREEVGRSLRRQEVGLAANERGGERDREPVAVDTEVDDMRAPGKLLGERRDVRQETRDRDDTVAAIAENVDGWPWRDQRHRAWRDSSAHLADGADPKYPAFRSRRRSASGGTWSWSGKRRRRYAYSARKVAATSG